MENNFHRTIFIDIEALDEELDAPIMEVAAVAVESATYRFIDKIDLRVEFEMRHLSKFRYLGVNKFSPEEWSQYAIPGEDAAKKLSLFFNRHATVEKISKDGNNYTIPKLAGHNSDSWDAPRIEEWFKKHDCFFHKEMLRTRDTMQKAIWLFEDNPSIQPPDDYTLKTLAEHLQLDHKPTHRALSDCLATVDLARSLAEFYRQAPTTKAAA